MLDHPQHQGDDADELRGDRGDVIPHRRLIYTGPIDEFFDYRFGKLPYRSLQFQHVTLDQEWFQPVAVVNYPQTSSPTPAITEYKHLTGQAHPKTSLTYEYPQRRRRSLLSDPDAGERRALQALRGAGRATPDVWFVGRLATYRYYNMDQVVGRLWRSIAKLAPMHEGQQPALTGRSVTAATAAAAVD